MRKRYIVSLDFSGDGGCISCLRETLCVHHDANKGEVIYHAKPVNMDRRTLRRILKYLNRKMERLDREAKKS